MSKHTPGPWEYRVDYMECPYVASKTKHMIADVNLAFVSGKEAKANARLIACAPDMLEALQVALIELKAEWGNPTNAITMIESVLARIEEE